MLIQVSRHYAIRVETAGVIRGGVVRPVRGGFAALRILPGDVASVMAGVNSPPERVTQLREQLGLNRPLIAQYFDWMSALARGDFGTSILTGRSVTSLVGARASITFPLIILALLIALVIGLPLGCAAVLARSATVRAVFHVLAIVAVPYLRCGAVCC